MSSSALAAGTETDELLYIVDAYRTACRRGLLPRATGRLSEEERKAIKSGDIYVFNVEESQIKRYVVYIVPHYILHCILTLLSCLLLKMDRRQALVT